MQLFSWVAGVCRLPIAMVCVGSAVLVSAGVPVVTAAEEGYYQWPTLAGDRLVFASEGDLWSTRFRADGPLEPAIRLTTHAEEETHPVLSPDATRLAFVARYESAADLYVMPASGGAPRRLTFEGGGVSSVGWLDEHRVLYVTSNIPGPSARRIRTVDVRDGSIETLPLADANALTQGNDALYFSRYGLSLSRDNAVHYRGGRMAQLWRLGDRDALVSNLRRAKPRRPAEAQQLLTEFGAPIRHPMWWQGRVYFVSDQSGSDNFWSVADTGRDTNAIKHTTFTAGQILAPQLADGRVVFQRGADLMHWDVANTDTKRLAVQLVSDREQRRVRQLGSPLDYLRSSRLSPDGEAVAVTARGQIALAYPGTRRRVTYAVPGNARARGAVAGAEALYAIVDVNRFSEIWAFNLDGSGSGRVLIDDAEARIWSLTPSPDGAWVAFDDQRGRLWLLDTRTGRKKQIAQNSSSADQFVFDLAWSPGGRYLSFAQFDSQDRSRIQLYDTRNRTTARVSSAKYEAFAPAFSHDGKWLYFSSDRHFNATPGSPWGDRNLGAHFDKRGRLFALQLELGADFPFAAAAEDLQGAKKEAANTADDDSDDEDNGELVDAQIEFAGLQQRLWPVPVAPDNVVGLLAAKDYLYVRAQNGDQQVLHSIKIESTEAGALAELKTVAEGVVQAELSVDRKTLLVQTGEGAATALLLVPASAELPKDTAANTVRIADWTLRINPVQEWAQQLRDAWRMHRDFAYDTSLRSLDWEAVLAEAEALLPRVGSRGELNALIRQMVAPLGILHSQVRGGDVPADPETAAPAFLGADLDADDGRVVIKTLYQGEPDLPEHLGPLQQPGLGVNSGDVIAAIDGRPVQTLADVSRALAAQAGQQVRLDLRRGRRDFAVLVVPVDAAGERRLRYRHWVQTRAQRVAAESDGQLGYLHLEAMTSRDIASFARDFYAQLDKKGIVIDVRGNRGGNIDSWVLTALMRQVWAFWESPSGGQPFGNMQQAYRGHLAVLINEGTYSDGETFAAGVKALGITDLIGTRTAGAGIWLTGRNALSDNGMARIAELPQYGLDGRWLIEGQGVSPDIVVSTLPVAEFFDEDVQLRRGIEYLQEKIKRLPIAPLRGQPLPPVGTPAQDVGRAVK